VDAVGNRTSQTIGIQTTNFTLNNDDELTATASSTGGFVNSYSYNANGEQTGRTLLGTVSIADQIAYAPVILRQTGRHRRRISSLRAL
jgi:hypothetical protein